MPSFQQEWDSLTPAQQEQARAVVQMADAIREAIDALGEVPAGHLYARLCDRLSLTDFNRLIGLLVSAGKVERRGDLLVSKNPKN